MKAIELNQFLLNLMPDIPKPTVDRVTAGDPDRVIKKIAVCWQPFRNAVAKAKKLGANVIVTHEPVFFDHWDIDGHFKNDPETIAKKQWIDKLGITIIRCHDVWDRMPEIGITPAWEKFLGLSDPIKTNGFARAYAIKKQSAAVFAKSFAAKIRKLGQKIVPFYGDPKRRISSVGIGTGCTGFFDILALGVDAVITVDDVVRSWTEGSYAESTGTPFFVVHHGISEEPGMVTLAAFLKKSFPDIPVTHIRQGCSYKSF